ncbi:MAG: sodium/proline symporter PutP [Candidatus Gastranaerophilales bacterium]|nr:sodium/proline symporter PutP [Candidatus Gastranaerophilales bacterium]
MNTSIITAFILYFTIIIGIGIYYCNKQKNINEYFLGGRNLNSWVTAMSAQASDMSGWLLMGLPAAAYISGLSVSWIGIGLAFGTYLNWKIIAGRLRVFTDIFGDSITIPQYLQNRFLANSSLIRIICAIVIFIFFLIYTASAFNAQAKVFQYLFNIDYIICVTAGALIILTYTFLGGFLAVCWTELFQGLLMFFALLIIPVLAWKATPDISLNMLAAINNGTYLNLFKSSTGTISLIGIISNFAWGLGYLGMPHILVRFMAIRSGDMIKKSRIIAMTWVILTLCAALAIGIIGYVYLKSQGIVYNNQPEAEIIFIISAVKLAPFGLLAGVLLSAVLAAIMSTAASQLLVTASTLSNDFYKLLIRPTAGNKELMIISRVAVLLTVIAAYFLALNPQNSVMKLVSYAWSGFGASFGPVILLSLFWKRMTLAGGISGIISGATVVLLWENIPVLQQTGIYSILPAFFVALIAIILVSLMTTEPQSEIEEMFDRAEKELNS